MAWTVKLYPIAHGGVTKSEGIKDPDAAAETRRIDLHWIGSNPLIVRIPVFDVEWKADKHVKASMRCLTAGEERERLSLTLDLERGRERRVGRITFELDGVTNTEKIVLRPESRPGSPPLAGPNLGRSSLSTPFARSVCGIYAENRDRDAAYDAQVNLKWERRAEPDEITGLDLWYPVLVAKPRRTTENDYRVEPWLFTTRYQLHDPDVSLPGDDPETPEAVPLPTDIVQVPAEAVLSAKDYADGLRNSADPDEFRHGWIVQLRGLGEGLGESLWNRYVDGYVRGIELAASEPASFVPRFLDEARTTWAATYLVVDRDAQNGDWDRLEEPTYRLDGTAEGDPEIGASEVRTLSLQPDRAAELAAELPLTRAHSGSPLRTTLSIGDRFLDPDDLEATEGCRIEQARLGVEANGLYLPLRSEVLARRDSGPPLTRRLRMGALDLEIAVSTKSREEAAGIAASTDDDDTNGALDTGPAAPAGSPAASRGCRPPEPTGWLRLLPVHPTSGERFHPDAPTFELAGVETSMQLAVAAIEPGGQDEPAGRWTGVPGEEPQDEPPDDDRELDAWLDHQFSRPAPLVLALPSDGGSRSGPRASLEIHEKRGNLDFRRLPAPGENGPRPSLPWDIRRLDLRLKSRNDQPARRSAAKAWADSATALTPPSDSDGAIVLDSEPFLVALVRFGALDARDDSASDEIARWTYDGFGRPAWRLFLGNDSTWLQLPPQGVGEAMERYRNTPEGGLFDFRFSPPATLAVRESNLAYNYSEPPWNLRRLLADEWEESPGLVVQHLEYELLYGLFCNTQKGEAAGGAFLRLADVLATAGPVAGPRTALARRRPPLPEATLASYRQARIRWARTVDQLQARLAVLETWDPHRPPELRRRLNVECRLRRQAKMATVDQDCDGDLLCGGALYGVEPPPVYQKLRQVQDDGTLSDDAHVDDLRLSSLGGFGVQTARFLDGLVTFIAEVSMGRLQMLRVEVLGRIACWWNHARYVVIYRRLPGPTEQFACYQNSHEGRMALRKAEEFVEILQPKRRYPDSPRAGERHTGCVEACVFEEGARFNVLSFWGETVGEDGWKIPIWRSEAAEDPNTGHLYPEPQVAVSLYSSVDGESRPASTTLANPENLYFYTEIADEEKDPDPEAAARGEGAATPGAADATSADAGDGSSRRPRVNPDLWAPVVGIDLVDEPRPAARPDFQGGRKHPTSPPDVAVPPGHGPCTFHLHPAPFATDLAAFRGLQPLGAHLATLTMSRGRLAREAEDAPKRISRQVDELRSLKGRLESTFGDADRLKTELPALANELRGRLEGLCRQMDQVSPDTLAADLGEQLNGDKWLSELQGALTTKLGKWLSDLADDQVEQAADAVRSGATEVLLRLRGRAVPVARGYLATARNCVDAADQAVRRLERHEARAEEILATAERELDRAASGEAAAAAQAAIRQEARRQLERLTDAVHQELAALADSLRRGPGLRIALGEDQVLDRLTHLTEPYVDEVAAIPLEFELPDAAEADTRRFLEAARTGVVEPVDTALTKLRERVVEPALKLVPEVGPGLDDLEQRLDRLPADLERQVIELGASTTREIEAQLDDLVSDAIEPLKPLLDEAASKARSLVADAGAELEGVKTKAKAACGKIENALNQGADKLQEALQKALDDHFADLAASIDLEITRPLQPLFADADGALRLVRAFGRPPEVEGLGFDRPEIAYFLDELVPEIDVTPVLGRAAQAAALAGGLKPLGIDLPTTKLSDRLLPPELEDFDVSSILPDVAGVDLSGLFPDFKMPGGSQVDVQHGLDPETRRAWLQADFHAGSRESVPLFSTGALSIVLSQPNLSGRARMEGRAGGALQRRVEGTMKGTWELIVGSRSLVRFPDTTLFFNGDGDVRFELRPELMQLDQTLEFVQTLLASLVPGDGSAFRIEPTGVVAELSLPLPNLQGGTFGITNLALGSFIALRHSPRFAIEAGFNLGRPLAPFTLSVFILGGAGYLTTTSRYLPETGEVEAHLDMAIAASASLALSLGPIEGGVYVYFGVHARYHNRGALDVGLFVLVRGHVSILGIVSATIALRLTVAYGGGSAVIATGEVSIRIKICWCFTLEVDESVTYRMGTPDRTAAARSALPGAHVQLAQAGGTPVRPEVCPPPDPRFKNIFHQRVAEYLEMVA